MVMTNKGAGKAKILAVINQKGGVGKSTSALHVGLRAIEFKQRVLFVDLDGQANGTASLLAINRDFDIPAKAAMASDLFRSRPPKSHRPYDCNNGISLLAATSEEMERIEQRPDSVLGYFKNNFKALAGEYDLIVFDCPPHQGNRFRAALSVADYAIAPILLDDYSLAGIQQLLKTVQRSRKENPALQFLGLLPNKVMARDRDQADVFAELRSSVPQYLFPVAIHQRSRVANGIANGVPAWKSGNPTAGREWKKMCDAVLQRMD